MMLPITTNTSAYIIQPPLVNTTTPGTGVVHVPPDNVTPSVSSSQVDNNSKPDSTPPPAAEQTAPAAEAASEEAGGSAASASAASSLSSSAQAPFIAQLAGQDGTQETYIALQQYEKLIEYSNVKYKPSNAFKPPTEPSSLFVRILQSEKTAAPVSSAPSVSDAQAAATPASSAPETQSAPPSDSLTTDVATADTQDAAPPPAPSQAVTVSAPAAQSINAYIASSVRVAFQAANTTSSLA